MTEDWVREVDGLPDDAFAAENAALNRRRVRAEPVPAPVRRRYLVSTMLRELRLDLPLVNAARVLAQRDGNYHLGNSSRALNADFLEVDLQDGGGPGAGARRLLHNGRPGPVLSRPGQAEALAGERGLGAGAAAPRSRPARLHLAGRAARIPAAGRRGAACQRVAARGAGPPGPGPLRGRRARRVRGAVRPWPPRERGRARAWARAGRRRAGRSRRGPGRGHARLSGGRTAAARRRRRRLGL